MTEEQKQARVAEIMRERGVPEIYAREQLAIELGGTGDIVTLDADGKPIPADQLPRPKLITD